MMKIKWNWGTGLFIGASLFILMIAVFAYYMFKQNFDLVEKDYYPKALVYQQRIDKLNNTAQLEEKIRVEKLGSSVVIRFPYIFKPDSTSGTVQFYRPSGVSGDVNILIQLDASGIMSYPISRLMKGNYMVKIDYNFRNKGYYQEEALFVP
jgi:hypothetical protein